MEDFAFEQVIERRGGDSVKWNRYADRDVLPLWVADMDFAAPPAVVRALEKRVAHACFGYAEAMPSLHDAVIGHLQRAYDWRIEADWLVWLPGLANRGRRAAGPCEQPALDGSDRIHRAWRWRGKPPEDAPSSGGGRRRHRHCRQ